MPEISVMCNRSTPADPVQGFSTLALLGQKNFVAGGGELSYSL
jgi:hypothetical protein